MAIFTQNKAKLCKNFDHHIGFWEKRQIFRRKWSKIAENYDHNIDPWVQKLTPEYEISYQSMELDAPVQSLL
jgi:hypothetical protein